jgi:hypothetical protein
VRLLAQQEEQQEVVAAAAGGAGGHSSGNSVPASQVRVVEACVRELLTLHHKICYAPHAVLQRQALALSSTCRCRHGQYQTPAVIGSRGRLQGSRLPHAQADHPAPSTRHPATVDIHTDTLTPPPLAATQAEVLLCVKGPDGSLPLRMLLVQQLWALGIRAELLPRACPELREQYEWAAAHGIRWLVLIDEARLGPAGGKQEVRVKSLERRSEEWVALADVTRYMQVGGWWGGHMAGSCAVCGAGGCGTSGAAAGGLAAPQSC